MDTSRTRVTLYLDYPAAKKLYDAYASQPNGSEQVDFEGHFSEHPLAFLDELGAYLVEYPEEELEVCLDENPGSSDWDSLDSNGGFKLVFDHYLEVLPKSLWQLEIEPNRVEITCKRPGATNAIPGFYSDRSGRTAEIMNCRHHVSGPTLAAAQVFWEGVIARKRNSLLEFPW